MDTSCAQNDMVEGNIEKTCEVSEDTDTPDCLLSSGNSRSISSEEDINPHEHEICSNSEPSNERNSEVDLDVANIEQKPIPTTHVTILKQDINNSSYLNLVEVSENKLAVSESTFPILNNTEISTSQDAANNNDLSSYNEESSPIINKEIMDAHCPIEDTCLFGKLHEKVCENEMRNLEVVAAFPSVAFHVSSGSSEHSHSNTEVETMVTPESNIISSNLPFQSHIDFSEKTDTGKQTVFSTPCVVNENSTVNDFSTDKLSNTVSIKSGILNSICAPCSEDESDTLLSELETELEGGDDEHYKISLSTNESNSPSLNNNSSYRKKQSKTSKEKYNEHNGKDRPTIEYYEAHMEFLERTNSQIRQELSEMKERFVISETEYKKKLGQNKAELMAKLDKMTKQFESARKEKEAMVVRYAQSERDVILAKKARDELEKKLRDAAKDRENLISKIKGLNMERMRICSSLDNKMVELATLQREHEKLKEDLNAKDIRIKWAQNKLKTEMESHKETQNKLEHTLQRLQDTREEAEQIRKDCQEMIRRYQEAEEIKSVSLDHQLRQKLNELEVQKQERSDQEEVYQLLRQEMEALKKKHKLTIEENNTLTVKINSLEKERLDHEQTVSKLKDSQNSLKQDVVDLTARLAEMENLRIQLEREKEKLVASQREVERLRQTNAELQADMEACHNKEGELLEFTERLTAKSVHLQSEHSLLETKAQTLDEEMTRFSRKCSDLEQKNADLSIQLEEEQKQREEETQLLARKLAEKTKTVEQLTVKLDEAENENRVMKRRHITSIKELARELQNTKKRLEIFESSQLAPGDSLSLGSRASSTGSLDTLSNNHAAVLNGPLPSTLQAPPPVTFSGGKNALNTHYKQTNQTSPPPSVSVPNEVDKQMLIERIVWLQKSLARKNEKIEFLEEHISQLLQEIKKKSKIIQSYIIREEAGALISNSMDQNKLELSKRGGIMASVYSSHPADSHLTLELSLEINQKLQAVLEDTLLKNITLKENISTLGEEIARLTKEQRELSNLLIRNKCGK